MYADAWRRDVKRSHPVDAVDGEHPAQDDCLDASALAGTAGVKLGVKRSEVRILSARPPEPQVSASRPKNETQLVGRGHRLVTRGACHRNDQRGDGVDARPRRASGQSRAVPAR